MPQWEYRTLVSHWSHNADTTRLVESMNKLGERGWELVSVTRDESPEDVPEEEACLFLFKRQKKSDRPQDPSHP
ncbi:MAG: hypothetical protein ABL958_14530 [Bdellovibrionia bacterium]